MNLEEIINQKETTIIDVREPWEFSQAHVEGSLNIPLGNIETSLKQIKELGGSIIMVCASGNRSGMATSYLTSSGIKDVYNGGSWKDVKLYIKEKLV